LLRDSGRDTPDRFRGGILAKDSDRRKVRASTKADMRFNMPRIRFVYFTSSTQGPKRTLATESGIQEERSTEIKRTYQPKKRYRRRVHGFMKRMSTVGGARVIQNRRRKGRARLGAS